MSAEHMFLLNIRAFILLHETLQFFLLHKSSIPFMCLTSNSSGSLLRKPIPGLYVSPFRKLLLMADSLVLQFFAGITS